MDDPINTTKRMAESHGLAFKDCGQGHVQIRGNGTLVNYYPSSRNQTAFCAQTGETIRNCTPFNACRLAMDGKADIRPQAHRKPSKEGPDPKDIEPERTNPSGIRHFHESDVPPWDESLGEFAYLANSDRLRGRACAMESEVMGLRAHADRMDEEAT